MNFLLDFFSEMKFSRFKLPDGEIFDIANSSGRARRLPSIFRERRTRNEQRGTKGGGMEEMDRERGNDGRARERTGAMPYVIYRPPRR